MGLLENDKVGAASTAFQAIHDEELLKVTPWALEIAEKVAVTGKSVTMVGSELMGGFSKWEGTQEWQNISATSVTVTPDTYNFPVEIERDYIDDDGIGQFAGSFVGMGIMAGNLPNKLVADAFTAGYATVGMDGCLFFGTHTDGNGHSQVNTDTDVLDSDALDEACNKGYSFVAANGEPIGFTPTHLFYGVGSKSKAEDLLDNQFLAGGASNKWYKRLIPIFSQNIQGNDWFVLDLSKGIKPFKLFVRQEPEFTAITSPDAECVKNRGVYQYYSRSRMCCKPLHWQLCVASTGDGI